jgi:hypothetical protein
MWTVIFSTSNGSQVPLCKEVHMKLKKMKRRNYKKASKNGFFYILVFQGSCSLSFLTLCTGVTVQTNRIHYGSVWIETLSL